MLWTKKLIKKFPNTSWRLQALNKLLENLQETGTTARKHAVSFLFFIL